MSFDDNSNDKFDNKKCSCYDELYECCNGTKERDLCSCKGNQLKCDFYEHMRNKELEDDAHNTNYDINYRDSFSIEEIRRITNEKNKEILNKRKQREKAIIASIEQDFENNIKSDILTLLKRRAYGGEDSGCFYLHFNNKDKKYLKKEIEHIFLNDKLYRYGCCSFEAERLFEIISEYFAYKGFTVEHHANLHRANTEFFRISWEEDE